MPTYEYVCHKCDAHLEVYQSFDEAPLKRHNGGCGGKLTKVLAPVGVVLKGSGFYKTDSSDSARSRSKAKSTSSDTGAKGGTDSGSGSDSGSDKKAKTSGDSKSATSDSKSSSGSSSGSTGTSSKSGTAA
jgi:putative FmdB family regulatory protein